MFLNLLSKQEKEYFLKLAIALVRSDERLEESEKFYIAEYAKEADISNYDLLADIDVVSISKEVVANSTNSVRRIFIIELIACAYADGDFSGEEKELIDLIVKEFGISNSEVSKCKSLLNNYMEATKELTAFVKGEN